MKKYFICIVFTLCYCLVSAQENKSAFSPTISVGYVVGGESAFPEGTVSDTYQRLGGSWVIFGADYLRIGKNTSFGSYFALGTASYMEYIETKTDSSGNLYDVNLTTATPSYRLGFSMRWHLLQTFYPNMTKWDVACNFSVGSYSSKHLSPQSEFGIGVEFYFYPFKHIGIFCGSECGKFIIGNHFEPYLKRGTHTYRAGVVIKIK